MTRTVFFMLIFFFSINIIGDDSDIDENKKLISMLEKRLVLMENVISLKMELRSSNRKILKLENELNGKNYELKELRDFIKNKLIPGMDKFLSDSETAVTANKGKSASSVKTEHKDAGKEESTGFFSWLGF